MASEDTLLVMGLTQRALNNWYMFSHSPPSPLPLFPSLSPSSIPLPLLFLYSPPSPLSLFPSLSSSSIPLPLPFLYSPPSPLPLFPSLSSSSIPLPLPFFYSPPSPLLLFQCASTMLIRSVKTMPLMIASIVQHTIVEQV